MKNPYLDDKFFKNPNSEKHELPVNNEKCKVNEIMIKKDQQVIENNNTMLINFDEFVKNEFKDKLNCTNDIFCDLNFEKIEKVDKPSNEDFININKNLKKSIRESRNFSTDRLSMFPTYKSVFGEYMDFEDSNLNNNTTENPFKVNKIKSPHGNIINDKISYIPSEESYSNKIIIDYNKILEQRNNNQQLNYNKVNSKTEMIDPFEGFY